MLTRDRSYSRKIQEYFETTGTTHRFKGFKTDDGFPIGQRIATQRVLYKKGYLSAEHIQFLENFGDWSWDTRADIWPEFFSRLQKHYETTGTTRALRSYKTPDDYPLGDRISISAPITRRASFPPTASRCWRTWATGHGRCMLTGG